jgi:hypothetical protein
MPRITWLLHQDRPRIEVILAMAVSTTPQTRALVADTGAGSSQSQFELVLTENDCLSCGGKPTGVLRLGGAYSGSFPVYTLRVQVPQLGFDDDVKVVGVPSVPSGFDGLAGFRFLNRFTYGNFGSRTEFGIET